MYTPLYPLSLLVLFPLSHVVLKIVDAYCDFDNIQQHMLCKLTVTQAVPVNGISACAYIQIC